MNAERRSRFLELYFHLLLALYSIAGIGNGILGTSSGSQINGAVLLYVSILTLAISLIIFGFKFGELAAQHRSCYLMLQRLLEADISDNLNEKYISTIENLPNHQQIDFLRLVIQDPFSRTQALRTPDGTSYTFTRLQLIAYVVRRMAAWVFLALLTLPAWLVTFWNLWHLYR
ncbi:SLATT domain-containing protein [Cereibacter changlensis]|uniref:SLATT domain-containing protein n=2 Tax=Cereibacter changlensis TaxID=402884 RepID=A0A4U0Z0D9_9RHOB|nr:SLATT domain-containing protein [Cereibacter changlensis]